jgi:glycosyltransferase involved in cell wall biosynthesis
MQHLVALAIPAYQPGDVLLSLVTALRGAFPDNPLIVIDDGSSEPAQKLFTGIEAISGVTLLRHAVNLGKGAALKTALNYYLLNHTDRCKGMITVDADGQHLVEDVLHLAGAAMQEPGALWLGMRSFGSDVPLRSKFGNIMTRHVFSFLIGTKIQDTQTGLRFIPNELMPGLLAIKANRYEFELEMLLVTSQSHLKLRELPIKTVYEDGNKSSHFRPLVDSARIYFVFIRFLANSLITAGIDYLLFAVYYAFSANILHSFLVARLFACMFNFSVNKYVVFKTKKHIYREIFNYVALVLVLMAASYFAVTAMVDAFGIHPVAAKIISEGSLFFASFAVQRLLIFSKRR